MADSRILSAEEQEALLAPIDKEIGGIQAEIDKLRENGSLKVRSYENQIILLKEDKTLTKDERDNEIAAAKKELEKAKQVEAANRDKVAVYVKQAEDYLKAHYDSEYFNKVKASCDARREQAKREYDTALGKLANEHEAELKKLTDKDEIKDENYVYKNRKFDQKMR